MVHDFKQCAHIVWILLTHSCQLLAVQQIFLMHYAGQSEYSEAHVPDTACPGH